MQTFARGLTAFVVVSFAYYAGCGSDGATGGGTSTNITVTNGTGYSPACNDGQPDGFCNPHGALPETCECYDCLGTDFCTGACIDDGTCTSDEDCTCVDCAFMGGECGNVTDGPGPGPGPGPTTGGGGGMGGAGASGGSPSAGGGGAGAAGGAGNAGGTAGAGG